MRVVGNAGTWYMTKYKKKEYLPDQVYRKTCKTGAERNFKNAHGLVLMKNKFLSSPESGMGKIVNYFQRC